MYSKTNFMRASLVFITTLVSFFSLLGVVIGAKPFGFNPSNFHNPEMVFDPLTFVATVLILVVPIVLTLFSQKFLLGEKLTNFFEGPVFPPMFFGLVFGIALKILATSAVFILSPGSSASLLVIPVGILSYLPYFA